MPLTLFFGVLTLAPLVMALALAGLGLARRATPGLALGLTLVGVIIPIIGLALLAPEVSGGFPLEIALLGDQSSWIALYGRVDMLSVYAAIGVAVVVAPLVLWLAWRAAPLDATEEAEIAATETEPLDEETATAEAEGTAEAELAPTRAQAPAAPLGRWQWTGLALALTLETLALWVCFAENIALLGIVWIALIAVAWALGELGSESAILDWRGLSLMVVGPLVWLVTVFLIAGPAGARRLLDLTGAARLPMGHLFVLSLALIFAAGAYPALAWLRKRASIATPAGLAAISLAVMPAALFVGARTYSIGATLTNSWPELNIGKPSITIGIVLTLFGALSVAAAGLLALWRRDPRSLVAALTLGQAGWGLVGLGVGAPLSLLGVTLLLATGVFGLGAVIAALVAAGAVTADVEPDSAGPRVLGEPLRPALMFAWIAGVASLVGAPLLAGFPAQQLISAEALTGPRLSIPLVGVAWVGSALLAIALIRATAPAFTAPLVAIYADDEEFSEEENADEGDEHVAPADEPEADELDAAGSVGEGEALAVVESPELRLEELPGIALGALILIVGVAPGVALNLATGAAGSTLQVGALDGIVASSSSGYAAGVGQWFATAPVIFVVVVSLALAYLRSRMPREIRPLYLGGQEATTATTAAGAVPGAEAVEAGEAVETEEMEEVATPAELVALPEPAETWSDLHSMLRSAWLTPGGAWLGLDGDESASDEDGEYDELASADEGQGEGVTTATPTGSEDDAPTVKNGAKKGFGATPLRSGAGSASSSETPEGTGDQA